MKSKLHAFLLSLCCTFSWQINAADYMTYLLVGQSNMVGYGFNADLPAHLQKPQKVMIFHGNGVFDNQQGGGLGLWTRLKPGHGVGFKSDGRDNAYSDRFGAELSFAYRLSKKMPDKNIASIKYAVGGTGLALNVGYGNWSPDFTEGSGINQYDNVLATIRNAFATIDIDGDGTVDRLIPSGIVWMQGEADANASQNAANAYYQNVVRLMGLLRAAFRKDDVPVVIGKITDSGLSDDGPLMPFIQDVHSAQQRFATSDTCAAYMKDTENFGYDKVDPWHYLSDGFIQMGAGFAREIIRLAQTCD